MTYDQPSPHVVRILLSRLCAQFGFCIPPEDEDAIAANPPADPVAFVKAVVRAEGLDPEEMDRHLFRQMRDLAVAIYASDDGS